MVACVFTDFYFGLFSDEFLLLRKIIAATVMSNPDEFSEAVLEKPREEYCEWILNPQKWGG